MSDYVIALDQGTTSTRALVFAADGAVVASAQQEFPQHFPASGWVEHEVEDLWRTSLATISQAIEKAGISAKKIAALGITNQRETTIVWDKATGKAIHNAIVWQDRRTAETCAALRADGNEPVVSAKTGLLLDPYFSATKAAFILDAVPGARARAERGELLFGTVDSFLIHRLTGGAVHATDATNASRSLLLDIHSGRWDADLCRLFAIPPAMLPDVRDCSGDFGTCLPEFFGAAIPIRGVAGDQQAATIGQACFSPGMLKSTYGTGCFALLNTGETAVASNNRLLTTIAYQLGGNRTYALEGAIFIAGAAVQWLRDGLGIIGSAKETDALARTADPNQNVTLVPAFVGMGAPYWDAEARGALYGLTRATGPREIARATLESVCFQTADLLEAMRADWAEAAAAATVLRVDGGMVASDYTMQCLADLLGAPVDRPVVQETTALGAAILAGAAAGVMPAPAAYGARWRLEKRFSPTIGAEDRARRMAHWRDCVRRTLTHSMSCGRDEAPGLSPNLSSPHQETTDGTAMPLALTPETTLPRDGTAGALAGRVYRPDAGGPSVVALRGADVVDVSAAFPTMRDLCETLDPAGALRAAPGETLGALADILANSAAGTRDEGAPYFLAPIDLQALKAAGVTFAISMLERVIEEKARGNADAAAAIRKEITALVGDDLSKLKPGSDQAMALKKTLIEQGAWSQYLEVGIGPDAEIFTKGQVLSAVGTGAYAGLHPVSTWNNPEPEVVIVITSDGRIVGATLGNDVNLRDVEGRSALLLSKAKDNNASAAIGPFLRFFDATFTLDDVRRAEVTLTVRGKDGFVLTGASSMAKISRDPADLARQLLGRHHQYPDGAVLFLGTMFAPVEDREAPGMGFTHKLGDVVDIATEKLGRLTNVMTTSTTAPEWTFGASHLMRNLARRGLLGADR